MLESGQSDASLAAAAAKGERRAYTELMRRYKEPLYRYVSRSMRGSEDAYDVLQDTFTSAWLSIGKYDQARKFSTWLYRIALNKIRDHARKQAVRWFFVNAKSIGEPGIPDIPDPSRNIEVDHEYREELRRVSDLIDELPVKLRQAFTLQVLQDLPQSEVAEILGVSVKAVETRVYRARKFLLTRLDADS